MDDGGGGEGVRVMVGVGGGCGRECKKLSATSMLILIRHYKAYAKFSGKPLFQAKKQTNNTEASNNERIDI